MKKAASRNGLDPRKYGTHSLRAGFATEAIRNGAAEKDVMAQTGHRSPAILLRYVRRVRAWESPASAKLGL